MPVTTAHTLLLSHPPTLNVCIVRGNSFHQQRAMRISKMSLSPHFAFADHDILNVETRLQSLIMLHKRYT